ncbi:MAG: Clp protease N-terminal domain-containing protein [Terracidiphilus sp.]
MFERYTEPARRAIFYSRYEASFHSAGEIATGHILVGIIRERESHSIASDILNNHETNLRSTLGIPLPCGKPLTDLMKDIPLDRNAKMTLAYAANEAELDNSLYIYTDHLLRGILRFPNEASDALQSISLDLTKARDASKLNRTKYPPNKTLYHRLFGSPFRAHRSSLIRLVATVVVILLASLLIRWLN